jgi:hypothetical protein
MALDPVVNFFRSEIATLPLASGTTTMVITTGDGNKLPNPSTDGAFNLTIYNADDPFFTPEIVRCTAKSGDSLTITRAQEGTTATNKTTGSTWYVELVPTAKTIQDIDDKKLDIAGGTMTGDLTIPDKIIHSGDTNTAIRFPANDTFTVETSGVERVRVDSSGNVGIGVTPAQSLDIGGLYGLHLRGTEYTDFSDFWGTGNNRSMFLPYGYLGTNGAFAVSLYSNGYRNSSSEFTYMGLNGYTSTASGLDLYPEGIIRLRTGTASGTNIPIRMHIDADGNVGIGTTTPATTLDVNGDVTITDKIIHSGDTNTAIRFPSDDTVTVETAGSEALRVDSSQNVGIKKTNPRSALDVNGDVHIVDSKIIQKTVTCTDATATNIITVTPGGASRSFAVEILVQANRTAGTRVSVVAKYLFTYIVGPVGNVQTKLNAILAPDFITQNNALQNYASIAVTVETTSGDGRAVAFNFTSSGSDSPFNTTARIYATVMGTNLSEVT